MISIKEFRKRFKEGKAILENVSFDVKESEFVSIVGRSGCGKTTLLKCIAGLIPSSGQITKKSKATLVFQDYKSSLFKWKTVEQNIIFGNERKTASDISKYIALVGLKESKDKFPHQISGGMQQRTAIARTLAGNAEIILMDEPFGSLDSLTKMELEDELLNLLYGKKTVLFVTHDIDEAIYLSDRIIVLGKKPAQVILDKKIKLKRPRNQISTRYNKKFSKYRDEIFEIIRHN